MKRFRLEQMKTKHNLIHSMDCWVMDGKPCNCPVGRIAEEFHDLEKKIALMEQSAAINAHAIVKEQTKIENLTHWLQWALNELSGEDHEHTPKHECEFGTDPERGHCDFCDKYWSAMNVAWPERQHEHNH